MLTDNPTVEDKFGFQPYAQILFDTIRDTYNLPFTIGIFGQWGSGKSSLMLMIENEIKDQGEYKSIWFNPWKYDKKEELWSALIQSVLYKIADDSPNDEIKSKAKNLAISAGWSIIKRSISSLTGGVITEQNINDVKNIIAKQEELHYKYINQFEKDFEKVVSDYTGEGKLIVFIDDLDRCLPENAITVLESLKLFIGNAGCVFVLGMDQFIVEQGIKFRFGDKVNMSGRDYLDKIIQVPFYLPPVPFGKLKDALQVTKTAQYNDLIWSVIQYGLNGNPRKTKRFVNCFYLAEQILNHSEIDYSLRSQENDELNISGEEEKFYLAQLLIFQMVFPSYYEHLKYFPSDWEYIYTKVIDADSLEKRNEALSDKYQLKEFWENQDLKTFLSKTKSNTNDNFPTPPNTRVVEALLNAVSLISESERFPSN